MSVKQDRTYPRTATDLERKYNFDRRFSEILGIANDAQTHAYNAETAIRKWSQRVEGLEGNYSTIEQTANDITLRVGAVEKKNSELEGEIDGVSDNVKTISSTVSELSVKQDGITARVDTVETSYNTLSGTVDGISDEVTSIKDSYAELSVKQDGITARVDTVETNYGSLSGDIAALNKSYAEIVVEKNSIKTRVESVETNYGSLSGEVQKATAELEFKVGKDEDGNLRGKIHIGANQLTIDTENFKLLADGTATMKKGVIEEDVEIFGTLYSPNICAYKDEENNCEVGISYSNGHFSIGSTELSQTNFYDAIIEYGSHGDLTLYASDIIELKTLGEINFNLQGTAKGYFNGKWYFDLSYASDMSCIAFGRPWDQIGCIWDCGGKVIQFKAEKGYGLNFDGEGTNYLGGTWWSYSSGSTVTSDRNLKHDIENISEQYSALFDNLRAVTYKYNKGNSNRFHTGFIAQEVDEAITAAGLTRQDFAGLCVEKEGTDEELWGLRYGEFVALNTYEIQKLKKEVAELKARIGA